MKKVDIFMWGLLLGTHFAGPVFLIIALVLRLKGVHPDAAQWFLNAGALLSILILIFRWMIVRGLQADEKGKKRHTNGLYDHEGNLMYACDLLPGEGIPKDIWPAVLNTLSPANTKSESGDGSPARSCVYREKDREWYLCIDFDAGGFVYWEDLC